MVLFRTLILYVKKFSVYAITVNPIVSFKANNGSGTMADVHVSGGGYTLPVCAFTRSGYSFSGWNTKADGSGKAYADRAALSGLTGDITLYAQWTARNNNTPPSSSGGGGNGKLIITPPSSGELSAGTENPPLGAKVIITAKPDLGYELYSLDITDGKGNKIPYTDNGDGTYTFTMPEGTATVTAIFKEIPDIDKDSDVSGLLNTDDHFAYVHGRQGNVFAAQDNMTRAEVAQMFYNLLRDKSVIIDNENFPDVQGDAWYAAAVNTLASLGIVNGFPDGNYYPDDPITRAQFAAIVVRFAKVSPTGAQFDDVFSTHWAYDYINTAAHFNWVDGVGDNMFAPERKITRAEAVTLVNRMLRRCPDKEYIDSSPDLIHFSDEDINYWAYYEIMEAVNTHGYSKSGDREIWNYYPELIV